MSDNGEMGKKTGSDQQIERTRWSRTVNRYLILLHSEPHVQRRGGESLEKRIAKLNEQIETNKTQGKWHMVARYTQRRIDIEEGTQLDEAERDFIAVVAPYSEQHDISYAAWRQLGVSAGALSAGGMRL